MLKVEMTNERWPLLNPFVIARGAKTVADVVTVTLRDGTYIGRGECEPSHRYGESVKSVLEQISGIRTVLETGIGRTELQALLPPGAARNAVDCALWELEAARHKVRVWELAGVAPPREVVTCYTLSLDTPEGMLRQAEQNSWRPLLKLKLGGSSLDLSRVQAVRTAVPNARIIVDANESWTAETYDSVMPHLRGLGVEMVEQPFKAGEPIPVPLRSSPVPVCADESCHVRTDLPRVVNDYHMINIKLDKTGGLTEALALQKAAGEAGMAVMTGCMLGTSLAMAPALIVASASTFVDLDAPLLLERDRPNGLVFDGSLVRLPAEGLWGTW